MAVRKPLKYDGSGGIKPFSTGEINGLITRAIYSFSLGSAVTLSRVNSGGSLGSISDTRKTAGAALTSTTSTPPQSSTDDVGTNTINHSKVNETVTTTSKPSKLMPPLAYATPDGNIKAMSDVDYYDTIVHPAIDLLVSGSLTTNQAGTYFISTATSVSGATLVDSNPVFTDTRADETLYSAGGIPEDLDQPKVIQHYYLHVLNGSSADVTRPLCILDQSSDPNNDPGNLREYSLSDLDLYFRNSINYSASQEVGYRIRYSWTSGTTRGSLMLDTALDGSSYRTLFVDADDYRAQEHPDGNSTVVSSHSLKISKS